MNKTNDDGSRDCATCGENVFEGEKRGEKHLCFSCAGTVDRGLITPSATFADVNAAQARDDARRATRRAFGFK